MAAFNKSNWTRSVESDGMVVYAPGAIPNVAVAANSGTTITLTVPFKFKGNAMLEVTLPTTATPLVAGLALSEANLLAPAAGSYAAGNHPRVSFKITNSTTLGITPPATDLIVWQS